MSGPSPAARAVAEEARQAMSEPTGQTAQHVQHQGPMQLQEFRAHARDLAKKRLELEQQYEADMTEAAESEAAYQAAKAKAFIALKNTDGVTATEASERVRGEPEVQLAQVRRDEGEERLRLRRLQIDGLDSQRATLHRVAEWSMKYGD